MKQPLSLLFLLVIALVLVPSATAQPDTPPSHLAAYLPDDTLAFVSFRSDDAYFEQLDAVIDQINRRVPGAFPPDATSRQLYDGLVQGTPFSEIAPWVGDTFALALIPNMARDVTSVFVFDLANREALLEVITDNNTDAPEPAQIGAFSVYGDPDGGEGLLVSENVALLILDASDTFAIDTLAEADFTPLSESETFTTALDSLPADSYNISAYIDTAAIAQAAAAEMPSESLSPDEALVIEPLLNSLAAVDYAALGLTILDNRSFTVDISASVGSSTFGLFNDAVDLLYAVPTIDTTFADKLPAHTQFLIQGTDLNAQFDYSIDALSAAGALLRNAVETAYENGDIGFFEYNDAMTLLGGDLGGLVQGPLTLGFASLTGLNLQDDVLSWMTSDYALTLSAYLTDGALTFTPDLGLLIALADGDAVDGAQALIDALQGPLIDSFLESSSEGGVLTYTAPLRIFYAESDLSAGELLGEPALDFRLGASDEIFAMGARPTVDFALGEADNTTALSDTDAYQYAADSLFLPDANALYYINFGPLAEAALSGRLFGSPRMDLEAAAALSLLESATITNRADADTGLLSARLTITLATAD